MNGGGQQKMTPEQAIAEIDELLKSCPPADTLARTDGASWRGRFSAVLSLIAPERKAEAMAIGMGFDSSLRFTARNRALSLLHELRYAQMLSSSAPTTQVVGAGLRFDYFDEVRKLTETATTNILFVDPYLHPDFVARYLPHVQLGVQVRLLGSKGILALKASVGAFVQQTPMPIEVRQSGALHDRFVFIDGQRCYQSGASFKDGAAKSPAVISQIVDAFDAMQTTYEALWAAGTP